MLGAALTGLVQGATLPSARADTPVITDGEAAVDAETAGAIAAAFDHPVVISSETTETSQTSAMPDGSLSLEVTTQPSRVQLANGAWTPTDLDLAVDATGMAAPSASAAPVAFSMGGPGALARVQNGDGSWLTISSPVSTGLPQPTLSDASATYAELLPDVDLRLAATPEGMSEVLVIKSATGAANPALDALRYAVAGAPLAVAPGGAILSDDGENSSTLLAPAPTWWDASDAGSAAGPGGDHLPMPVPTNVSASAVTINAGAPADTHSLTYPLFVDPGWTRYQLDRTFVDNAYRGVAYWNGAGASDGFQHVGKIDIANSDDGKAHVARSFWQYDVRGLYGAHVSSAQFSLDNTYSQSCNAAAVNLGVTDPINSGTTWDNQPAVLEWIDSQSFAQGRSDCPYNPAQPVGFNAKKAVQRAADGNDASVALTLQADEGTIAGWKKFSANAKLRIVYVLKPQAPRIWDNTCNRTIGLLAGDYLKSGEVRYSHNAAYYVTMQTDGNLVLRDSTGNARWSSGTSGTAAGGYAGMQGDGSLVIRDASGNAKWNSGTADETKTKSMLAVQDDGDLTILNALDTGRPDWRSRTDVAITAPPVFCYDRSQNPSIAALGFQSNNMNQFYRFYRDRTTPLYDTETRGSVDTGEASPYYPGNLGEGSYNFGARVCVRAEDNYVLCGDLSDQIGVVIDRTPPAPPKITDPSGTSTPFTEVVGKATKALTITSTNGANDHLQGVIFTQYPTLAGGRSSVFPANAGCSSSQVGYTVVCTGGADIVHNLTVAAAAEESSIAAIAFDLAGNAASSATTVIFQVNPDWESIQAGHSWPTYAAPSGSCPKNAVSDTAASGAATLTLSATGTVCWASLMGSSPPPLSKAPSADGGWHPNAVDALTFSGTSAIAQTNSAVLDSTTSFSVGAWIYTTSTTGTRTILAQANGAGSTFELKLDGGQFKFCAGSRCAAQTQTAAAGNWYFVAGVFDSINQQLRLVANINGDATNPVYADNVSIASSSSGGTMIGSNGTASSTWQGQILNPFAVQGVLSQTPTNTLGKFGCAPKDANVSTYCKAGN